MHGSIGGGRLRAKQIGLITEIGHDAIDLAPTDLFRFRERQSTPTALIELQQQTIAGGLNRRRARGIAQVAVELAPQGIVEFEVFIATIARLHQRPIETLVHQAPKEQGDGAFLGC